MKSFIQLENIRIFANHGVFAQETLVGNHFVINLKITTDLSKAIESDNLDDTISYATAYDIVEQEMAIPSKLLEHVAGRIIKSLKNSFAQIEQIELKISKVNPPVRGQLECASITIID